ncbi:hypothetical protein ABZY42_27165 [Streptomyces sp. NPDC006622]|uniref:hypothetical protein n=1 Tax=Streptomyces sp. NPDC006622 TaxID=3155459 RepID=UPI0033BB44AA
MPADEVTTGSDVDAARVRTGPRHAAPKKPLLTRLHMPAGKAIALAAMPTAVLMGMGFTPTLANAEDQPASKSLTIDEYKDCVAALEGSESPSASPTPSASASASESADDAKDDSDAGSGSGSGDDSQDEQTGGTSGSGDPTSPDSGSGEADEPAPAASSAVSEPQKSDTDTATAGPSPSETDKNLLETIGDTITDLFDGKDAAETATASPTPSASESASTGTGGSTDTGSGSSGSAEDDAAKDDSGKGTAGKDTTDALTDAVKDTAGKADDTAQDTGDKAAETAADATASPSPSESATTDVDDCPVATEDESGIDNKTPLPDDPWYLNASSLLLKGADYQGIVEVKTANGTKKKVLKYVISEGTDIGDLHQTVDDKQAGVTYHVQAGSGTTSTIRNGDTIMYTESISGNLFGLIPVTFDPENPPPLNIPLIYFTKAKVVQAGQFGGDLHIPGMHLYNTK